MTTLVIPDGLKQIRPPRAAIRQISAEQAALTLAKVSDLHHPEHAQVDGCDYKDTNLVCAEDGQDWPCRTKQIIREGLVK